MKVNQNIWEEIAYYAFCLCTVGFAFFLRIIISVAIRRALKDEE